MSRAPGSRSQVLASQHSSLLARNPLLELGASTSRSRSLPTNRPTLKNRPRSLGALSQVSQTSSNVELGKQYKSWASARAQEARLRAEFNEAELRWRRAKQTYQRTRKQYEKAIDPSKTNVDPSSQELANLRELFGLDRAYLETQAVEVTRRKQTLEAVQRDLQHNETRFIEAARQTMQPELFRAPSPMILPPEVSMIIYDGMGKPELPIPQLDGRLTRYYEKEAQANIFGERLADLNYDYNEALTAREFRRDHDEALSTTDEQFEAGFRQDRAKVEKDLDDATEQVRELKAACDSAGLDVEAHRSNVVDSDDTVLTDAQFTRQEEYQLPFQESTSLMPQAAFDSAETIEDPPSDHASDTFIDSLPGTKTDDRLNKWIESLTA
jgi:hypothetical protein